MKKLLPFLALLFAAALQAGEITIVCTTDLHGRLRRLAPLGTAIRSAGADALRIDCGDTVQGTFESRFNRGRAMIDGLNALEYDFWIPGNHDFEFGFESLRELTSRFRGRVLAADWSWRGIAFPEWALVEHGSFRVAIIGLTDPRMPKRVLPGTGMQFRHPYTALTRVMPEIRRAAPDLIVLAWHNGLYSSIGGMAQFLKEFPEIDLVLGGHSHETHPGKRLGRAYYVQPPCHGEGAALIHVRFDDSNRKLLRIESEIRKPDFRHPDPAVQTAVGPALREAERARERVVARTTPPLGLPEKAQPCGELGRIGAAALRRVAGTDVGYFQLAPLGGEKIRQVTAGELFRLLPYENRVCTIELSRREFLAFAAETFEAWKKRKWSVPAWSGVKITAAAPGVAADKLPERLTLALTDFVLSGSRTLRPLLEEPERAWHILPLLEREAVEQELSTQFQRGESHQ